MTQAVLFDLDGVLVDTEGVYTRFWSDIESRFPTGIDDFANVIKGNTLARILSTYYPDPTVSGQIKELLKAQEDSMQYMFFDGALELLQSLRDAGIKTAIVTSSNRAKLAHLFEQHPCLPTLIDTLVTDGDVARSKPAPDCYLLAADRLGADIAHCWVVEDSLAGLTAGRSAGARVAGLCTTNAPADVSPMCDVCLPDISHLSISLLS